jgi:hypothetical protein
MSRFHVLIAPALLVALLAGCAPLAPTPTPSSTAKPTPTATKTASPTPTPAAVALVIPACESVLSIVDVRAFFSESTEFLGEYTTADIDFTNNPWSGTALAAASQSRICIWGVPNSDGAFTVRLAELDESARAALQAELTASGYSSTTMGAVTAMTMSGEGDDAPGGTNLFTGDLWIQVPGGSESFTGNVAGLALDGLRTANPTLGL